MTNVPGELHRGDDVCVALGVRSSPDKETGGSGGGEGIQYVPGSVGHRGQRHEVRKGSGIFEDQKIILHSWT